MLMGKLIKPFEESYLAISTHPAFVEGITPLRWGEEKLVRNLTIWADCWVSEKFLRAHIPQKRSGSITPTSTGS